ncbi:uncharacterized protein LOC127245295 [Andrographis paniculata]|uniref:uncharacterized protein LOC127245295 n=1 Tax=Andrographis paniculata TaxID=175694 RepID=UPI0021E7484E|nr:uncharacterized protein LOC127245295 [Andrographis paniculata]
MAIRTMRVFYASSLLLVSLSILAPQSRGGTFLARTPPRGWNSYDSFCWTVSEQEFLENARLVSQRLRPLGYEYAVVDYLWYRKKVPGANVDSLGFDVIDEWGRVVPDTARWPSSGNGKGFVDVAAKVHSLGLKFGIHIMRGISTQAYNANTPILDVNTGRQYEENGKKWFAKDVGVPEKPCAWMKNGFMSVNTKLGAGRAFLESLHRQYAEWGIDFVKHDCVFGDDFDPDEITFVSGLIKKSGRPVVYSLSPGTSVTPAMANNVSSLANMYRITGDDWDKWPDVAAHFDITRDLAGAGKIGAIGRSGKSWPDSDMLPFGWLTDPGSNDGPHRNCNLTPDEQRTQITLWAMAKSPLMFGGDMRRLNQATFDLLSNPTILRINSRSKNNKEFPYISSRKLFATSDDEKTKDQTDAAPTLVFTSCHDVEARGWSVKSIDDNLEQVCWDRKPKDGDHEPFCLYKRAPLLTLDTDKRNHDGKVHLLKMKTSESCLDASPNQRPTATQSNHGSYSPCRSDTNQMWEVNRNGTLRNSYSGLCASMKNANDAATGVRAWIADLVKGRRAVYLALFNLDTNRAEISAKIQDLGKAIPGRRFGSCRAREVWSGKDFGDVKDTVSATVESHGTALFELYCS